MCFVRNLSPESAMEHCQAVLPYRDMVIGTGLDLDDNDRPPSMFAEIYQKARQDGFRITAHCDVGQKDTHRNTPQVATDMGESGSDRIDLDLNAVQDPELMRIIKNRAIGMTITPLDNYTMNRLMRSSLKFVLCTTLVFQ